MATKTKTTAKPPHHGHIASLFLIALLILIGIVLFVLQYFEGKRETTPVIDSKKTEMKKLPPDIKKQLLIATPSATLRVPILMYHYVEYVQNKKDTIRESLNIEPDIFEQQIVTLKNAGYTFMTAKELGDVLDGKMLLPEKPILVTFDDGHWDLDTDVLPILKKYHVKVTAYIISGFIGTVGDAMTPQQLRDVIQSGLVEIGAHTVHHIALKGRPLATVQYEVDQSKATLEQTYGLHVVSFAYPDGSFDQQAVNVVKSDGFETAVSTIPGIEQNQANRYFLYRLRPGRRRGQVLLNWLQQNAFTAYGR